MTNNNLETAVLSSSNEICKDNKKTECCIKAIIFDLGNVVIPYDLQKSIEWMRKIIFFKKVKDDDIENAVSPKKMELIRKYQKGMPRKGFFNEIEKRSKIPFAKNFSMLAEQTTYAMFSDMNPEMERLIKGLKGNYPLAVLSNITDVKPEEAVFIDDYKRNVDAAKEIGINALLFNSTPELKSKFYELGICP